MDDGSKIHSHADQFAKSNSMVTLDTEGYIYFTGSSNGVRVTHCIGKQSNYYVIKHSKGDFSFPFIEYIFL